MGLLTMCLLLPFLAWAQADGTATAEPVVVAPAYQRPDYDPPPVGSYRLPSLGVAADGQVLDTAGASASLHDVLGSGISLLSFIYTSCADATGCPLATSVLYSLRQKLLAEPDLAADLRLVSLSFDPQQDTPEVMGLYGAGFDGEGVAWRFVTTAGPAQLQPILDDYDQAIQREYGADGKTTGTFSHILRVYLIDSEKRIRNIYSVSFLYPELLLHDMRTLQLEQKTVKVSATDSGVAPAHVTALGALPRAGDYKDGYDSAAYETRSVSLQRRTGRQTDLLAIAADPPLGLPPLPDAFRDAMSEETVSLGRKLFYDRRLSLNDTFSCAICHIPEQGFTSNELATAVGFEGRTVRRNAPTIYNVAYARRLFHDGREETLEQQVWAPLLARNEMANPSIGAVLEKIRHTPDYAGLFEAAFGRGPSMETLGQALASYQRTLLSADSSFDRWRYGGERDALPEAAKRGFELFTGKAGCVACHTVGEKYALLSDDRLHNTGIGYRVSMAPRSATQKVTLAPGVVVEVPRDVIRSVSENAPNDLGLYEITQNPADRWKYRTPTLRNVALTAPYMHNGALQTLREVVEFYNRGGEPNEVLDPLIRPLSLQSAEIDDLVAFLESLTGANVAQLVADAFAAPVGDVGTDDPNWTHANRIEY